ncbi:MAG: hypothetical protein ACE5KG_02000 [Nitrososphaerales archaeon]
MGDSLDALYVGIREFPVAKVMLIGKEVDKHAVEDIRQNLEKFRIPVEILPISGGLMEGMFRAFAAVKKMYSEEELLVNVATGDRLSTCAALSAAYVNGLMAFGIVDDKPMMLPILKFSYYKLISDRKMEILRVLTDLGQVSSLDELSKATRMSLPLVSYHIHGNPKSEGLDRLGLVHTTEGSHGRTGIKPTELGKLLIEGCVT